MRKRADEFTKHGCKSSSAETDDYGGVYDKTTINKVAKVVVTIVYNIES